MNKQTGYLLLETGAVFAGAQAGAFRETVGELVFTTGVTGYLETLTDPSFYGQLVMQTFPLIGNYGVIPADFESARPHMRAYIARELCQTPSNFRAEGPLNDYLKAAGLPALTGVDVRQLTRLVREQGVVNAMLSESPEFTPEKKAMLSGYAVRGAVPAVTCDHSFSSGEGRRVALYDFGVKAHIREALVRRGCEVITVPAHTPAAEVMALKPQGILLSNGPGDPEENVDCIRHIRFLFDTGIPMFGICLGHQMMALAYGGRTRKMKYGHRGGNQPVRRADSQRTYITSQNHGYCVIGESLGAGAHVSYLNANDGTCEGVRYERFPAFSVQFHPEAANGPLDTGFLFDEFIAMMEGGNAHAAR